MNLEEVVKSGYRANASDIHLMSGRPVMFRVRGKMKVYENEDIQTADMEELLHVLFTEAQRKDLEQTKEAETAVTVFDRYRIRVNAFCQQKSYVVIMRLLMAQIPKPEDIFLPSRVLDLAKEKKGLIIIAGESGCGKTTTAACLLNEIARNERKHIITIEDPVEYLIDQGKSMVSQRQIQIGTDAYAEAVRAAVRQDADVIFVGSLQDTETVSEAVLAAESGRLVICVLHTGCAEDTLQYLVESFFKFRREEMQRRFSKILKGIVVQKLLPLEKEEAQRSVFEVLLENKEIQVLIREGRLSLISSVLEKNRESGMQTMDAAVLSAYMNSVISAETAVSFAYDKEKMLQQMKIY